MLYMKHPNIYIYRPIPLFGPESRLNHTNTKMKNSTANELLELRSKCCNFKYLVSD